MGVDYSDFNASTPPSLLVVDVRAFGGAEPVGDAALGLEAQEKIIDAVLHPAGLDALVRLGVTELERKVDGTAARLVRELDAVLPALAHGVTVVERFPGVALVRVRRAAVVVRVVLLV